MAKLFKNEKLTFTDAGYYAAVFRASGSVEVKRFPSPELPLEWLQKQVDGYIEIVRGSALPAEAYLIVNEDGLYKDLPLNRLASWCYSAGVAPIVGDTVLCCDFDARTAIFEPDAYAAPLLWMRSLLERMGLLASAVLVE